MTWDECDDEDSDTDPIEQVLHERLLSLGLIIVRGKHGVTEVPESRVDLDARDFVALCDGSLR